MTGSIPVPAVRLSILVLLTAIALTTLVVLSPERSSASAAAQPDQSLTPEDSALLFTGPGGAVTAVLRSGAALTQLARDGEYVRVRVEGWVRESELVPVDSALRFSPGAADIRADPNGMRGRSVRWDVEFISLQRADPLRRDLKPDEWYILARGPGSEAAIVYLVVPPDMLQQAQGLAPLSRLQVTAIVRVGRSQPVGIPILDIVSLSRR